MCRLILFWTAELTLADVPQHALVVELPGPITLALTRHPRGQLIFTSQVLMSQVLHMSHTSHGPLMQDGQTIPHTSRVSRQQVPGGMHFPQRSQEVQGLSFREVVYPFRCASTQILSLVDHMYFMHHHGTTSTNLLKIILALLFMIIKLLSRITNIEQGKNEIRDILHQHERWQHEVDNRFHQQGQWQQHVD